VDKLRIGLIGCGEIAVREHLPAWAEARNAEVVAICDVNVDHAREQATRFDVKQVHTDYQELLERADVDAVDICLPHDLHGPVGIDAAKAGKHILVEKPITLTLEEAVELIDACERARVKLMVGHIMRFTPQIRFMKQVIDSGILGKITHVASRCFLLKNILVQAESKNQPWKISKAGSGGGAIHRDGIHHLDILRWFCGSEVMRVTAEVDNFIWEQEVESCGHILMRFRNRAIGELVTNYCTVHPGYGEMTVTGTTGTVRIGGGRWTEPQMFGLAPTPVEIFANELGTRANALNDLLEATNAAGSGYSQVRPESLVVQVPAGRAPRTLLAEHFVDCARDGLEPLTNGLESAKALEVIIGAYRAAEQGSSVDLPLFPLDRLYERGEG
jgi:predicted dehydrogenase